MKQNSLKAWLLAARPKTLTGCAVPVMIGLAWAWADDRALYDGLAFRWVPAVLCLLFAFVMQTDANLVNDFFDYVRGTDDQATRLGPERACASGWVTLDAMKRAIAATTVAACLVGLPLAWYGGLELVLVGVLCVVCCFLYTTLLSYHGMGDLLVLLFFGVVPVCCTYYIQMHTVTWQVALSSLACGLVVDALLIVNNFRDRDTDREAGKNTLAVKIGPRWTLVAYEYVGIVACLSGLAYIADHLLAVVLPLIYLALHLSTWLRMIQIGHGRELNRCLGETARNIFIYGLTFSLGLLL